MYQRKLALNSQNKYKKESKLCNQVQMRMRNTKLRKFLKSVSRKEKFAIELSGKDILTLKAVRNYLRYYL